MSDDYLWRRSDDYMWRSSIDALAEVPRKEILRLRTENKKLRSALIEARECIESWAAYADSYFQEKWDLAGDLAAIDAVIEETKHD